MPGSSGGSGAFIMAAPNGVRFAGDVFVGRGVGVVYGTLTLSGTLDVHVAHEAGDPLSITSSNNDVHIFPYHAWRSLKSEELALHGGGGGGGAGGDGQGAGLSAEERGAIRRPGG